MRFTQKAGVMIGAYCCLTLSGHTVFAAPTFTGTVADDFTDASTILINDPGGIDVGVPIQFPTGTISGNDIQDLYLYYDVDADCMYVGFDMYGIGGDVDGDGDPSVTSSILLGLGGFDNADFGGTESFAISFDIDEDGLFDIIAGVPGASIEDINDYRVAEFIGTPFAPGVSFGPALPDHQGDVFSSPSAAEPDIEFTIPNFSLLPTSSGTDSGLSFGVNGFVGSFSDAGIGEDFTPGAGATVQVCFDSDMDGVTTCEEDCDDNDDTSNPDAGEVCDGADNDCDGSVDEGFDADGDGIADCFDDEDCDGEDNDGDGNTDEGFDSDNDGLADCFDTEECDGLDNDGDTNVDEDFDADNDGIADCFDTEECDGLDNDGDGSTDEGFDSDSDGTADCFDTEECDGADNDGDGNTDEGFDSDSDGTADCFDAEECDGLDNDGDGSTDEGFDSDSDGTADCFDTEECDGLDNDGDGSTDEGFDSDADGTADCFDSEDCDGLDNDGDSIVDEDTTDSDSDGLCDDLDTEECDGLDNDGDGNTDEGFDSDSDGTADCFDTEECDGLDNDGDGNADEGFDSDADGTADCFDTEECDGLDNDGDGSTDEGFDSDSDGTADCFDTEDCDGLDNDGDTGVDEGLPDSDGDKICDELDTEFCDGVDNDGDDEVDEGFDSDSDGIADCFDSEDCDGVDNDGDGEVDEDTADTDSDGLCDDLDTEECDGLDNDGDGNTDEGFDSDNDGTADCFDGEECDGLDNDGDGSVDEGTTDTDSDGLCDDLDTEECDGLDNDGDGSTDEGFDSDSDGTADCFDSEECDGLDNDGDGSVDEGTTDTDSDGICDDLDTEECDGADNDGDGSVDEGFDADSDGTADCFDTEECDGLDNDGDGSTDEGFDSDSDGTADCFDSEECDGADNDGDGNTDEGFDSDSDGTADCFDSEECDDADNDGDGSVDEGLTCEPECVVPATLCDAGCYSLGNKPNGEVSDPDYGLRLDGLFGTSSSTHYTFSFEAPNTEVEFCYDGAGNATINGIAYGGRDIGEEWAADDQGYLDIAFAYSGVTCEGGSLVIDDTDGAGSGSVTYDVNGETVALNAKANNNGIYAHIDPSSSSDYTAYLSGWLMYEDGPVGTMDFGSTLNPNSTCPAEVCDGEDNDLDGAVDEEQSDSDNDGLCDDLDTEECDGLDNDGDGNTDEGFDSDSDGTADCFDSEDCDGLDNDGDSIVDEDTSDSDSDGICDDLDTEECDGLDNDGDGNTDEGFDSDSDGTADCFDSEDCDGADNDGDGSTDEGLDCDDDTCLPDGTSASYTASSASGHSIWLPGFNDGNSSHKVRMHFEDDARFVIDEDGDGHLYGTATVYDLGGGPGTLGEQWTVDVNYDFRGQGEDGEGPYGPKIENASNQPESVTDTWLYFDMVEGTLAQVDGDDFATISQMPADGSYPFQLGEAASGKNTNFGASGWLFYDRINAWGEVAWDGSGDFNIDLDENDFEICECPLILDFENDPYGRPVQAGENLAELYSSYGVHFTTFNTQDMAGTGRGIAFDSSNPTGGDDDLGTPNSAFGGPGVGAGGASNTSSLGMMLISAENFTDMNGDGIIDTPDDDASGAWFAVDFDTPTCVESVDLVDIESSEGPADILLYGPGNQLLAHIQADGLGDNSVNNVEIDVCGVVHMMIDIYGSGAIDNLVVCPDEDPGYEDETCDGTDNDGDGETDEGVLNTYYPDSDGDGYGSTNSGLEVIDGDSAVTDYFTAPGQDDQYNVYYGYPFLAVNGDNYVATRTIDELDIITSFTIDAVIEHCLYCQVSLDVYFDDEKVGSIPLKDYEWQTNIHKTFNIDPVAGGQHEVKLKLPKTLYNSHCWYSFLWIEDIGELTFDGLIEVPGAATEPVEACEAPDGYADNDGDCDDADADVNPGSEEVCNGFDDDCDGFTDDDDDDTTGLNTYYPDADGDGYGTANAGTATSVFPAEASNNDVYDYYYGEPYMAKAGDNYTAHRSSAVLESVDSMYLDMRVDQENLFCSTYLLFYFDNEYLGYAYLDARYYYTDLVASIPLAGVDGDNHSLEVELYDTVYNSYCYYSWVDLELGGELTFSGVGAETDGIESCDAPAGYASNTDDCNDSDAWINPSKDEVCNGVDDDCDGTIDEDMGSHARQADSGKKIDFSLTREFQLDLDADIMMDIPREHRFRRTHLTLGQHPE